MQIKDKAEFDIVEEGERALGTSKPCAYQPGTRQHELWLYGMQSAYRDKQERAAQRSEGDRL